MYIQEVYTDSTRADLSFFRAPHLGHVERKKKPICPKVFLTLRKLAAYAACDSVEIQGEHEMPAGSGMNFIEKWYEILFDIKDIQFFVANTLLGINISVFFSVWHFWVDNVPVFPQWKKGSELRVQSRGEDESLVDSRKSLNTNRGHG